MAKVVKALSTTFRTCKVDYLSSKMILTLLIACTIIGDHIGNAEMQRVSCTDENERPQRCTPEFVNAAFLARPVEATNTCGQTSDGRPVRQFYCLQTGATGGNGKSCGNPCDDSDFKNRHPPKYLTDLENKDLMTWWQSATMAEADIQYPSSVNLTLHLGKSYDITYIRLKFHSSRPESFSIYKKTREDGPWIPYQYYSGTCFSTYRRRPDEIVTRDDETYALCSDDYSDISPLSGAEIPFSTLEGRPSMRNFDNSPVLQEWVTATDIRIVLNRLNTFGDEVFADEDVLKSYFYAITDFAVGGICKCNGHASECVKSTGQGLEERFVCRCEHNTMGPDCEQCEPFHNDRPWARAAAGDANECLPCDCNGLSNRCYFDEQLYRATGHGGHCLDCRDNTDGPHCERCQDYYYRNRQDNRCTACACNDIGSGSLQCDDFGRCRCNPGVTGEKCDRCQDNFYDFSQRGCRACSCLVQGSLRNEPRCSQTTGICTCKEKVEGQNCDRCVPGHYGLSSNNPYGCISCFCYGHSSICSVARGYIQADWTTQFGSGVEGWTGSDRDGNPIIVSFNGITEDLGIAANDDQHTLYFSAPATYLGDQRFSYNQYLSFSLRVGEEGARASINDIILEGNGRRISAPIFSQGNPTPGIRFQQYKFRLHEHPEYQWTPRLSAVELIQLLSDLTAIYIRGTYNYAGVGFLDNVRLQSSERSNNGGDPSVSVEQCNCPRGYVGQFCESCEPGYRRDPPNGGPFARCVPCNCNGHSDSCDVNTGRCICQHNTVGDNCDKCAPGYYGYALSGTENDCQPCPCPDGGSCVELLNKEIACTSCREGYAGHRCDICADGYFGDPTGLHGNRSPCQPCRCNDNIDPNAVANCNTVTGECMKCIYNTAGFDCDSCLPGFYGDPLSSPKGDCKACDCYPLGTVQTFAPGCDYATGECTCLPHVEGRQCNQCEDGYWNIDSGTGCEQCSCNPIGSLDSTCDLYTGQCKCQPGIGGVRCDSCLPEYYGFSRAGCSECQCDPRGSFSPQCDEFGQCNCKDFSRIAGPLCDSCKENKYNLTAGCIDCPPCYNLVQDRVNYHRRQVRVLRDLINSVGTNPNLVDNEEFKTQLGEVNNSVKILLNEARYAAGQNVDTGVLEDLSNAVQDLIKKCSQITKNKDNAAENAEQAAANIAMVEQALSNAEAQLRAAEKYLNEDGVFALKKAQEAFDKFGQVNSELTKLSQEAREESLKQKEEADKIQGVAKQALNKSEEALRIAEEALSRPDDTAREIQNLKDSIPSLQDLYSTAKDASNQAKSNAADAYRSALHLFSEANNLLLPEVEVPQMIGEAVQIKNEAADLKVEGQDLVTKNQDLLDDIENQKRDAKDSLDDGIRQQQIADELLVDVDVARATARDAVARAEGTLKEANATLKTLQDFDKTVQESKEKAEEALLKVPQIESMIAEAEKKTTDAEEAFSGAEANAGDALSAAVEAQRIAEMASADAAQIQKEAGNTKDDALAQADTATDHMMQIDELEKNINVRTEQANEDGKVAREALMKAGEAKTAAAEAESKVQGALNKVIDILLQLDGLNMIDAARLDDLEANLKQAEEELEKANIDKRYQELVKSSNSQTNQINEANNSLAELVREVDNIKEIRDKLPEGCWKYTELEKSEAP